MTFALILVTLSLYGLIGLEKKIFTVVFKRLFYKIIFVIVYASAFYGKVGMTLYMSSFHLFPQVTQTFSTSESDFTILIFCVEGLPKTSLLFTFS
jgi:hypothetical protein